MALNEADTCRVYVTPKLKESGWENNPSAITEQYTFTDGRVQFKGSKVQRGEQKRADYLSTLATFLLLLLRLNLKTALSAKGCNRQKITQKS